MAIFLDKSAVRTSQGVERNARQFLAQYLYYQLSFSEFLEWRTRCDVEGNGTSEVAVAARPESRMGVAEELSGRYFLITTTSSM